MRRRQIYAARAQAAREAALLSLTPAEFTGGPITLPVDPHACPKCHRTIGRGRAMHEKHCKGAAA